MDTDPPKPRARLTRSREVRVIAGVCGGLSSRTEVDPVVYRVVFAVLGCFGVGLALYGAAWLLLPDEDTEASAVQRLSRRRIDGPAVLAVFVVLLTGGDLLLSSLYGPSALALVVVLATAAFAAHQRGVDLAGSARALPGRLRFPRVAGGEPPPANVPAQGHVGGEDHPVGTQPPFGPPPGYSAYSAPPRHPTGPEFGSWSYVPPGGEVDLSFFGQGPVTDDTYADIPDRKDAGTTSRSRVWLTATTLSTALLAAAAVSGLGALGGVPLTTQLVLAAATLAIGLGLLAGTWFGHGRPLIIAGLVSSVLLAGSTAASGIDLPLSGGFGEVTWVPHQQPHHPFEHGAGEATLNLTELPPGKDYTFTAEVDVGELTVRVPKGAELVIHAESSMGAVVIDGRDVSSGYDAEITRRLAGSGRKPHTSIELYLSTGAGEVEVDRVSP